MENKKQNLPSLNLEGVGFCLLHLKLGGHCVLQVDYRKYVAVNLATAHPHYDTAGNVLNMGTSIVDKGKTKYVLFKIPATVPGRLSQSRRARHGSF